MKILFFANTDWYLYNFRLSLAQRLQEQGHRVVLVSPKGAYSSRLKKMGFRWINFNLNRRGLNPILEGITILRLARLYWHERPDMVHHFTIKCVLYGSLVSHLLSIKPVVNSVTGLGYIFTEGDRSRNWLRWMVFLLYRIVLRGTSVIFQNPEDRALFIEKRLIDLKSSTLIRGSGVDTIRFSPKPEGTGAPLVIFPGRLLWDKGVGEFVRAARLLREEGIQARFALIGDSDPDNPSSIPTAQIQEWERDGVIEWWGWREDMEAVFAQADLVCFPSYYKEGMPKALIEASACGRPIITSDMPGCHEIVRPGENGLLVPPHDPRALADAMRSLIENPSHRKQMGIRGREIVIKEFSEKEILSQTLAFYHSL